MATLIKRALTAKEWKTAGHWWFGLYQGEQLICICCPACGHSATLLQHIVHDDGDVEPGVVCNECSFADDIVLDMYEPISRFKTVH